MILSGSLVGRKIGEKRGMWGCGGGFTKIKV